MVSSPPNNPGRMRQCREESAIASVDLRHDRMIYLRSMEMSEPLQHAELDPVVEAYKRDVDRTLIREHLQLSVTGRFERLMALQQFAEELRRGGEKAHRER